MNQDKEFSTGRNEWDSENVSCRTGRWNEQYHRRTAHCWKREITSFPAMCGTPTADANCSKRNQCFPIIQYVEYCTSSDATGSGESSTRRRRTSSGVMGKSETFLAIIVLVMGVCATASTSPKQCDPSRWVSNQYYEGKLVRNVRAISPAACCTLCSQAADCWSWSYM